MSIDFKVVNESAVNKILEELKCPVAFSYMNKPIALIPCMHRISDVAWHSLSFRSTKVNCPLCRKYVISGAEDSRFRELLLSTLSTLNPEKHKEVLKEIKDEDEWTPFSNIEIRVLNSQDCSHKLQIINGQMVELIKHAEDIPSEPKKFLKALAWLKKFECAVDTKELEDKIYYYVYCVSVQKGKITKNTGRDDWADYAIKENILTPEIYKEAISKACTLYMLSFFIKLKASNEAESLSAFDMDVFFKGDLKLFAKEYNVDDLEKFGELPERALIRLKIALEQKWSSLGESNNNNLSPVNGKEEVVNGKEEVQVTDPSNVNIITELKALQALGQKMLSSQDCFVNANFDKEGFLNAYNQFNKNILGFDASILQKKMWHYAYCAAVKSGKIKTNPGRDNWGQVAIENEGQLPSGEQLGRLKKYVIVQAFAYYYINLCLHLLENDKIGLINSLIGEGWFKPLTEVDTEHSSRLVVIIREAIDSTHSRVNIGDDTFGKLRQYISAQNFSKSEKIFKLKMILEQLEKEWTKLE